MHRRDLLKFAALTVANVTVCREVAWSFPQPKPASYPIIDSHIHLFDPSRPGGVPWPEKSDSVLYRPALPQRYAALVTKHGIVGAIAIEASSLPSDNDWLLKIAASSPIIVGTVGDLVPGTPTYMADLERLHRNPLFLGFRYGNLWNRDLSTDMQKAGFMDGIRALAQTGLVLESANPDPKLIHAILNIAEKVDSLRIVIDHLPHAALPPESSARDEYWSNLKALAARPGTYIKLSEIPAVANNKLITDLHFYQDALDTLWDTFGENRVLFGSDWPNSDHVASFASTFALVKQFVSAKGAVASEKFFWKNSATVYRWHPRRSNQPSL